MKNTIIKITAVLAVALASSFGLAACGGGGNSNDATGTDAAVVETESADSGNGEVSEAFVKDLSDGVAIVNEKIAEQPGMTQIMLASDVDQPTQKYGMWVMPFYPSDAMKSFIMTVQIDGDKFHVEGVDAETETTWQMDQDGNLTEVTE